MALYNASDVKEILRCKRVPGTGASNLPVIRDVIRVELLRLQETMPPTITAALRPQAPRTNATDDLDEPKKDTHQLRAWFAFAPNHPPSLRRKKSGPVSTFACCPSSSGRSGYQVTTNEERSTNDMLTHRKAIPSDKY
jgi:hypothetical protein